MEQDALDLLDLVGDQVRRLGAHSRTKKAITIFGQVGRQSSVSQFPGQPDFQIEPRKPRTQRTLVQLLYEIFVSFLESAISSVMLWTFALLRWIWKTTSAHKVILLLLVSSVFMNGLYTSQEVYQWWHDRSTEKFMARLGVHPNQVLSKAIYMRDIDDALANSTIGQASNNVSECFATFHQQTIGGNGISRPLGASSPRDSMTKSAARRLQQTRERLALYRHNLLVALRVVNSIEREVIENEWERWLRQELRRCRQVEALLGKSEAGDEVDLQADRMGQTVFAGLSGDVRQWYDQYCTSCQREQEQLISDHRVFEVS